MKVRYGDTAVEFFVGNKIMIETQSNRKPKIFTWHIHGSYLYYLTQTNCEFYLPVNADRTPGYAGRTPSFPWGDNVHEVPIDTVKETEFDSILFQSNFGGSDTYLNDQYKLFSPLQLQLPKIYIEHDPPRQSPTDTKHLIDNKDVTLVHVTHFNEIMWDNGQTPTTVIPHGVMIPKNVSYTGEIDKGIVVINNLSKRGRRLGLDIFEKVRQYIPLDLVGMGSKELGGLGEIPPKELHEFISHYRFFFNPIRYTSLGLSVCEAMMLGMPIVGLATTEMPVIIHNGLNGYSNTNIEVLIKNMHSLLHEPEKAKELGQNARRFAQRNFNIHRFTQNWENLFRQKLQQQI
jgi:glycosyltransferase involved in cell wall biosynthesis